MPDVAPSKRILLIGYRGTGKTTVATHLAKATGTAWIDTDAEVVRLAGNDVKAIFAQEGEEGFRQRETDILKSALNGPCPIIACGGGMVLREENRQLLSTAGTTVLLQATPETIYRRLQDDPHTLAQRPPLTDLEDETEIRQILRQREPLYTLCAQLIIDTEQKPAAQVAAEILAEVSLDSPRQN